MSYSPIERNPERYAHLTDDRDKRRKDVKNQKESKEKKDKGKLKEKAKVMPRVRLRSSSSEEDIELPPEPQKLSPVTRDSEVRALQLLRAKAKESLEKKIPVKGQKVPSPKVDTTEPEKPKLNQNLPKIDVVNKPSPVKEPEPEPVVQNQEVPPVKVEDIAIPDVPPLPPSTPPATFKSKPRSRDSSSSDSDRYVVLTKARCAVNHPQRPALA